MKNCFVPGYNPRSAGCFPVHDEPGQCCYVTLTIIDQDGASMTVHLPIGSAAELGATLSAAAAALVDDDEAYRRVRLLLEEE